MKIQTSRYPKNYSYSKYSLLTLSLLLIQLMFMPAIVGANEKPKEKPIERIPVYGTHFTTDTESWVAVCSGMGCKNSADSVQSEIDRILKRAHEEYVDEEEIQRLFCGELANKQPSHCSEMFGNKGFQWPYRGHGSLLWNIPSLTNGCGTGSVVESVLSKYGEIKNYGGYSGNQHEPISGYSFRAACNNHDACYSFGGGRGACDTTFHNTLTDICDGDYKCTAFADFYGSAVKIFGEEPYGEAGLVQQCREFQKDYKKNCDGVMPNGGGT